MSLKQTGRKSRTLGTQAGSTREEVNYREKGVQVGTYPDTMATKGSHATGCKKDQFPKLTQASKQVYLFLRGTAEYMQRMKNAFVRDKKVVENYGGCYVGIADNIQRCEGELYRSVPRQCIVVIRFVDMDRAQRWTESSQFFKQRDFPGPSDEVEIFMVPVSYIPTEDLCAFQMTEMWGLTVSPSEFQKNYVNHVTKIMNSMHIYHGVIASHAVNRNRNCRIRPDTFILINCADSESKLKAFYDSPEYENFKCYRHKYVAESDTCFFTLRPVTS